MAKQDPNDLPPPYYSVVVHTQPPLQPYESVVHGGGAGASLPSQIHYIPQYTPQVAAPVVTHPAPRRKKTCCENSNKYLGGSGSSLLLLVLLALAIWLGVKYGTRLPSAVIYSNEHEHGYDGLGSNFDIVHLDTCSNNTILCDGKKNCKLGSDEAVCVRFDEDGVLQVNTSQDGRFLPVCYEGWDKDYADQTCAQLGFRRSYDSKEVSSRQSTGLILTGRSSPLIQSQVNVSASCPGQTAVSLQCVECGQPVSTSRIIGGALAKTGQWPWQMSLHFQGYHTCGGVLIAPDFVLTAAHCFPRSITATLLQRDLRVYGGLVSQDALPEPYLVDKIIVNENYNNKTNDNDIALLKLTAPVDFSDSVAPACLPAFDQRFLHGTHCWTSGFGTTEEGAESASRDLMEVSVAIIDVRVCNSSDVYGGRVSRNMICAGDLKGGRDSCQGDSGGPLVCQDEKGDKRWNLVGITSWGTGCGRAQQPGVYTKVVSMLPWIQTKMQLERP